ncbi:MAG: hypothetical protein WD491_00930 [Balneolales bacterium]
MNLFSGEDLLTLFNELFRAKDELDVEKVIQNYPEVFADENWKPLGNNPSNYSVVKNQQANPVAALIEKITNSIDAILTKRCFESGLDPSSEGAPQTMDEAIEAFFPQNNWDLPSKRKQQAEEIQIIADGKGPKSQRSQFHTSVIIYDNGEGQHPEKFEKTFLSLLTGNKNDIPFVQGKYNMGGSGAIVFCGKLRFQLIASKRYDGTGNFGFTLMREHPKKESDKAKETWYEYLLVDGKIPSFSFNELEINLENRKFKTGTLIKMYSYQFPKGYSAISQDLNQSINEYLFTPALPILTKDTAIRYPNNKVLVNDLFGLKSRLFKEEDEYLEDRFSETYEDETIGIMKVSCYVFKTKVKDYTLKRTKEIIQIRYFKNNMSVLFSLNGQVHGNYTSEFISRSLKMNLLKSHLLIHVDCTHLNYSFRKELFMASRDRLKDGDETQYLRKYLASKLSHKEGRLAKLEAQRKQATDIDTSSNTQDLLKNFTKNLPLNSELAKLLNQTFKLDLKKDALGKEKDKPKKPKQENEEVPFKPERFPTTFKLNSKSNGQTKVANIPLEGERLIKFSTDAEDEYFDRDDEPGDMKLSVLSIRNNETEGGTEPGEGKEATEIFNVTKSSPDKGTIRVHLNPKEKMVNVGDEVQIKADLSAPGENFEETFWVKIVDKEQKKEKKPKEELDEEPLGLPPLIFAYENKVEGSGNTVSWEEVENATGLEIDYKTVMVPEVKGDNLSSIFVNMDSTVLMDFKSSYKNITAEQLEYSDRKYYTGVYFHTLFLYTITKNRGYDITKRIEGKEENELVDLGDYLKDLFDHYYSSFILNFGGADMIMQNLGD